MPRRRKKGIRSLKPTLHIFCEGEKTEPGYFDGYLDTYDIRRLKVIKIEKAKSNTPVQLVEEAIAFKRGKEAAREDEFWVVYDRESPNKYDDKLHQAAFDKAAAQDIQIALSNVCFEVWILLHFCYQSRSYTSYDDLIKNSPLKDKLAKIGKSSYKKNDSRALFDLIEQSIPQARRRAKKMNQHTQQSAPSSHTLPFLLNPYTDVYRLLDAIDEFVKSR